MTLVERGAVSEVFELGAVLLEETGQEEIDGEETDVEGQMILIVLVARQPIRGAIQPVVEDFRGEIQPVVEFLVGWVFAGGIAIAGEVAGDAVIAGRLVTDKGIVIAGEVVAGRWVVAGVAIAGGAGDAVVIAGCLVIGGGIVKAGAGGNPLRPGGKILLIADV